MKILVFNSLYFPDMLGGAEHSVKILCEELALRGHKIKVVCLHNQKNEKVEHINGVDILRLPIFNAYWPFSAENPVIWKRILFQALDLHNFFVSARLREVISEFDPDVIHLNNLRGFSAVAARLAGAAKAKVVITVRDYYLMAPTPYLNAESRNGFFKRLSRAVLDKVRSRQIPARAKFVYVSKFIKKSHKNFTFASRDRGEVIYNSHGFETRKDSGAAHSRPEFPKCRLGFLGRVDATKGVHLLLEAIEQYGEGTAVIAGSVGDDAYGRDIRKSSLRLANRVTLAGRMAPEKLFELIDYLVVPSVWSEPMGRVVVESYAFGIPVIVFPTGGLPELVIDGKTGVICSSATADALVRAIDRVRQINYECMKKSCLEQALQYSPEKYAKDYERVYASAMRAQ